jgi:hypothetical protein
MFVYFLIAAELAVLYGVYWYLYIREPANPRIDGRMWGEYARELQEGADSLAQEHGITDSWRYAAYQAARGEHRESSQFGLPGVLVLDTVSNHYVPAGEFEARTFLERLTAIVDRKLSHLNVRP